MPNKFSKQTQKEESINQQNQFARALWSGTLTTVLGNTCVFLLFPTTQDHHKQTSKNTSLRSNLRVFLARKFHINMYSWLTAGLGGPVPVVVLEDRHCFCLGKQPIARSRMAKSQKLPNTNGATLLRGFLMTE